MSEEALIITAALPPCETPADWARGHASIADRVTREAIPFIPSELQLRMFAHYHLCEKAGAPCRMVVPKTRRGGGSTGASALMYLHAQRHQARLGAIGTDEAVSMNMFSMIRFFEQHDTCDRHPEAARCLVKGQIEWANGSSWERYTAENPEAARSAGLQGYHATEVGRWYDSGVKDARETLRSMLGAVPRRGFTVVIEESTARGAQGAFYERFRGARWPTFDELGVPEGSEYWRIWEEETPQNKAGLESELALQFVRVFAAWFEDEENCVHEKLPEEDVQRIQSTLDEKEQALIDRYAERTPDGEPIRLGRIVTGAGVWEQLAWRRAVIATEFDGDVEAFQQENPSSPHEAFLSSGRHTFNRAGCAYMVDQARSRTPDVGVLDGAGGGMVFRRTSAQEAWLHVWHEPRAGHRYIIGVDTCGGRNNVRNPEDTDYHAALVIRAAYQDEDGTRHPHAVVASLLPRCQFDPDILARKVKEMSTYYGECMVVFEVNNTGASFRDFGVDYGINLYQSTFTEVKTGYEEKRLGWTTTSQSRHQLIGTLKKHIRNNARAETRHEGIACWSTTVAQECTDMMPDARGFDCAPGRKHDDHVMALGLALQCIECATYLGARVRKSRMPADRRNWRRM